MSDLAIDPTIAVLIAAFKAEHVHDQAACRAADKALAHLASAPAYTFDASELRVSSFSRGRAVEHISNGHVCTCEGAKHPWCLHRVEFRVLLAQAALHNPYLVRVQAQEQGDGDACAGLSPRIADVIAEITGEPLPFDADDDASYAAALARHADIEREIAELFAA